MNYTYSILVACCIANSIHTAQNINQQGANNKKFPAIYTTRPAQLTQTRQAKKDRSFKALLAIRKHKKDCVFVSETEACKLAGSYDPEIALRKGTRYCWHYVYVAGFRVKGYEKYPKHNNQKHEAVPGDIKCNLCKRAS